MPVFDIRLFGCRLREARERYGLTLSQLRAKTGIDHATLSRLETAGMSTAVRHKRRVEAATVVKLAGALDVSADYLLGLSDAPHPAGPVAPL